MIPSRNRFVILRTCRLSSFTKPFRGSKKKRDLLLNAQEDGRYLNNILFCAFTTNSHFVRVSKKSDNLAVRFEKLRFSPAHFYYSTTYTKTIIISWLKPSKKFEKKIEKIPVFCHHIFINIELRRKITLKITMTVLFSKKIF